MKLKATPFIKSLIFLSFLFSPSHFQEIGVDIMPATHYIMSRQDMQRLRDEINHDMRKRISNIEEEWQANEAIREVSSGVWNMQGSTYPALYNNNGLGGLGQQAMKAYSENYAKGVDPLNYKRKMEKNVLESHAETASKIENEMTSMNEKINMLKTSIRKSNEAAQSKLEIKRPKDPLMPKNEVHNNQENEASIENKIVDNYKNNEIAKPNESQTAPTTAIPSSEGESQSSSRSTEQSQSGESSLSSQETTTESSQNAQGSSNEVKQGANEAIKTESTARFLQKKTPGNHFLNGPLIKGLNIFKEIYN